VLVSVEADVPRVMATVVDGRVAHLAPGAWDALHGGDPF
jgi:hypothetical protein